MNVDLCRIIMDQTVATSGAKMAIRGERNEYE